MSVRGAYRRLWHEQRGSQGLEAAAAALAAAIIVAALLIAAPNVGSSVRRAFSCAAAALSGGGGCGGGSTAAAATTPAGGQQQDKKEDGCDGWCQIGGFFKGFGKEAVDTAKGFWTLGSDAVKLAFGDKATRDKYAALIDAFKRDPGGTALALGKAIVAPIVEDWKAGRYGEALGRGTFEVVATIVADKGLDKLGKLGKVDEVVEGAARYGDEVGNATRAGDGLGDTISRRIPCLNSFSARTQVVTVAGAVAIGKLQVGDRVLAYNAATGSNGIYPVTAVHVHLDPTVVTLTIDGEPVETTPEHHFFTRNHGWVYAGDLAVGAQVRRADGGFGTVHAVTSVRQARIMYNLTVATAHTFFVGSGQWLVHNSDCDVAMPRGYDRGKAGYEKPDLPNTRCIYCDQELTRQPRLTNSIEADHLVGLKDAFERGGMNWSKAQWEKFSNDLENLVAACKSCNASKQARRLFDEWAPPNMSPETRADVLRRIEAIVKRYELGP